MNGIRPPKAPSTTSTTPLNAPRLRGTRRTPAMLSPFVADRARCPLPGSTTWIPRQGAESRQSDPGLPKVGTGCGTARRHPAVARRSG